MAKGKKTCPKCGAGQGVRTKKCECGHTFAPSEGVKASEESMTLDPLDKQIKESVNAAKDIIAKVENRTSVAQVDVDLEPRRTTIAPERNYGGHYGGGLVTTPSGSPPLTP